MIKFTTKEQEYLVVDPNNQNDLHFLATNNTLFIGVGEALTEQQWAEITGGEIDLEQHLRCCTHNCRCHSKSGHALLSAHNIPEHYLIIRVL